MPLDLQITYIFLVHRFPFFLAQDFLWTVVAWVTGDPATAWVKVLDTRRFMGHNFWVIATLPGLKMRCIEIAKIKLYTMG